MLIDGTTALDQAIPKPISVAQEKYEEQYVLSLADRVLEQSLEDGNFEMAWLAVEKFRAMNKASSLGAARILHGVNQNWNNVPHEDDDTFIKQAMRRTGYSEITIDRYVFVWDMLTGDYIPEQFKENIWSQTMRQLVKEAETVVDQKYELDDEDWLALSEAGDYHRTMEICQTAKGKERNKNHMSLKIDENGDVWAYQGSESKWLFQMPIDSDDPIIIKAINRICKDSGISKKTSY